MSDSTSDAEPSTCRVSGSFGLSTSSRLSHPVVTSTASTSALVSLRDRLIMFRYLLMDRPPAAPWVPPASTGCLEIGLQGEREGAKRREAVGVERVDHAVRRLAAGGAGAADTDFRVESGVVRPRFQVPAN